MSEILIFVGTLVVVFLLPGPDMVLLLQTASAKGRTPAMACAAGLALARGCHVLLAATGLAALLRASPVLFEIIELAGASYLVWLGVKIWRTPDLFADAHGSSLTPSDSIWKAAQQGFVSSISNPKVLLFCSILLPQFIAEERGHLVAQFGLYGGLMLGIGFLFDASYAYAGMALGKWIKTHPRAQVVQRRVFGILLIAFGIVLAVT